jgi:hypothetical protein
VPVNLGGVRALTGRGKLCAWIVCFALVGSESAFGQNSEQPDAPGIETSTSSEAEPAADAEEQRAPSGADAADPTAAVSYQDIRYRYFDLSRNKDRHSFETEGAIMLHPRLKLTNELRGVSTDQIGRRKTDLEELKLKLIFLTKGMPLGIKAKYAVGVEWLKDLGKSDRGTGTGADMIAPLLGIGWVPTEKDFIVTLVQYFQSYDTDSSTRTVRRTGPRLIWIRNLPVLKGWFKADYKAQIDHQDGGKYTSILELQLGKMLGPRVGVYGEAFFGDDVLNSGQYDMGAGIGLRFMY